MSSILQTFLGNDQIQLYGHRVTFCGIGGATVRTLRAKLSRINVTDFCIMYVEIGTNDLGVSSAETVAADIWIVIAIPGTMELHKSFWGKFFLVVKDGLEVRPCKSLRCGFAN